MINISDFQEQREWIAACLRDETPLACNREEWDYMAELCGWEGVGPLLYMKLKDLDLPEKFLKALKSLYLWSRVQNNMFIEEIKRISHYLDGEGIPILLLKGAALIMSVYEEPSLRPMGDIDVMVKEENLEKVDLFLRESGYRITGMEYNKWDRRLGSGRTYTKDILNIDLFTHLEALYVGNGGDKKIFSRALSINKNIFIPSPEDLILHSLIHMANHHFYYRLLWLYDIKKISEKWIINWELIWDRIEKLSLKSLLILGLKETKTLFKINIPCPLDINLERKTYKYAKRFHGRLRIDNATYLMGVPGIKNKLILLLSSLFPSDNYLKIRFNINNFLLLFMYRLIRPFFIIFRAIKKISGLY